MSEVWGNEKQFNISTMIEIFMKNNFNDCHLTISNNFNSIKTIKILKYDTKIIIYLITDNKFKCISFLNFNIAEFYFFRINLKIC